MDALIIEDEKRAYNRLSQLLSIYDPGIHVIGHLDSVKRSIEYFNSNPMPDLVFMDVQLADGICFDIFEESSIQAPVIFTTAFDQYALEAFKFSGIYYLTKPLSYEDLECGMNRYFQLKNGFDPNGKGEAKLYKKRFLVKQGTHINSIKTDEITSIFYKDKITFLNRTNGKIAMLDHSMEQLEALLDPEEFFRINRSVIVQIDAIEDIQQYFNNRLLLKLKGPVAEADLIVSREKVAAFKKWLDQ